LQQQIEALQAQQQALASQLQPQQFLMQPQQYAVPVQQFGQFYPSPPQVQQHTDLSRQPSGGHGRNRSMHAPNMPPPPAPSAGSNSHVFDTFPGQINPPSAGNTASPAASRRGGAGGSGSGHVRRHSLALTEAKERAAARQQANAAAQSGVPVPPAPTSPTNDGLRPEYTGSTSSFNSPPALTPSQARTGPPTRGHARSQSAALAQNRAVSPQRTYQFPPNQGEGQQTTLERRGSVGSSHQRSGSRSDTNWRQPQDPQPPQPQVQQPGLGASQHAPAGSFSSQAAFGHRSRGSMGGGSFSSFPPGMPGGLSINPLYAQQAGGLPPILSPQLMQQQQLVQLQLQQQQQRKSLFAPYLPQGQLPALLQEGKLVSGILRVNKKNRSDAYVSTDLLESDIFICGSKDRNRALEGDFVAVELLDVDEVWAQKREKEDKKKRRGDDTNAGGLKRQGSIRIREGGKRKDDVEVEGQGLLLDVDDEEEVVEGQGDGKPMYAGHVVAVMERIGGQLFSGYDPLFLSLF
jgi:protein SSD1